jgi:cytochrome c nitrite reductase small subunit
MASAEETSLRERIVYLRRESLLTEATCNDCHTPHTLVGKYVTKAKNGFWHSFYFTTGRFPDPLRITDGNRRITEHACRDCHAEITDVIDPPAATHGSGPLSCVRCHAHVGHWVR